MSVRTSTLCCSFRSENEVNRDEYFFEYFGVVFFFGVLMEVDALFVFAGGSLEEVCAVFSGSEGGFDGAVEELELVAGLRVGKSGWVRVWRGRLPFRFRRSRRLHGREG